MWRTIQGRRSKDEAGSLAVSLGFVGEDKFKRPVSRRRRMFPREEGSAGPELWRGHEQSSLDSATGEAAGGLGASSQGWWHRSHMGGIS